MYDSSFYFYTKLENRHSHTQLMQTALTHTHTHTHSTCFSLELSSPLIVCSTTPTHPQAECVGDYRANLLLTLTLFTLCTGFWWKMLVVGLPLHTIINRQLLHTRTHTHTPHTHTQNSLHVCHCTLCGHALDFYTICLTSDHRQLCEKYMHFPQAKLLPVSPHTHTHTHTHTGSQAE